MNKQELKMELAIVLSILKTLKTVYESMTIDSADSCVGMCHEAQQASNSIYEYELFKKYYHRSKRGQTYYYDCVGEKNTESNQFGWHPQDIKSRLKWINKHISRIESGKTI